MTKTEKKKLKTFRLGPITQRRLHYLKDKYGQSEAAIVTMAIDRMFYTEHQPALAGALASQQPPAAARAAVAGLRLPTPEDVEGE